MSTSTSLPQPGSRGTLTNYHGCPMAHNKNSLTAGPTGPVLMGDYLLIEKTKQFVREKIPARNVHALGCGAHGTFTATNSAAASKLSCAKLFNQNGKVTPVSVRFSGIFTEQGEPDTSRDPRGFALKFKTEEGNWDLLTINTPVFNCRDMKVGPDAVHVLKKDPRTGTSNPNMQWDFVSSHPEALHQFLMVYSDRCGTPASFRTQHWFAANTFSFVNEQKVRVWIRFHLVGDQGWKGLTSEQAKLIAGQDPSFLQRDLKESIEQGRYPRWKLSVQTMSEEDGYKSTIAFDCTKSWPHAQFPLTELGVIELNRNPVDYFTEVEEIAFSPARLVPGISISPDKLLQGRMLVYDDAQHHRIGPNFQQLPINCPLKMDSNYYTGGAMNAMTFNKFPHYQGSSFPSNEPQVDPKLREPPLRADGPADYYDLPGEGTDADYYQQPRDYLKAMEPQEYTNLTYNLADHLQHCLPEIVTRIMTHFQNIDSKFADQIRQQLATKQQGASKTRGELAVEQMEKELKM